MQHPRADNGALHPAVTELYRDGTDSAEAVERFLARQFPLVEDGFVTFAWYGDAQSVALVRWIHAGAERTEFSQVAGSNLWLLRLPVENDGRFEYKLAIRRNGHDALMLDPKNQMRAGDPFGENSVCQTLGYSAPDWSRPRGAPEGKIIEISLESDVFAETRVEKVYLPADFSPENAYPLVVIHDGADYVTYADLSVSLDNLIEIGDVPPVIVALVQTRDRLGEYARGRRHARYLVHELLPEFTARYSISSRSADRVLLGASLGAVASLATAFRYPGVFGGLVLKSGSFILDERRLLGREHPVFHRVARLVRALRRAPDLPSTRAFVSTGELEGLAEENRALANLLRERGVDVMFSSAWDGHHWHNWRDQLRDGLMWVLGSGDTSREDGESMASPG